MAKQRTLVKTNVVFGAARANKKDFLEKMHIIIPQTAVTKIIGAHYYKG